MSLCENSLEAKQSRSRATVGGSIPAFSLHSIRVDVCDIKEIQEVIERVHYSHSIFGVTKDFCFSAKVDGVIVGGAIFGKPAGKGVAEKYSDGLPLLELRRFVMEDEAPKNSETKCLAIMLRRLRKEGIRKILSYADPAFGHRGTIYRTAGFKLIGETAKRKHVMWKGKKYPDRNIHQVNFPFHLELRAALLDGSAYRVSIPSKLIYLKGL